MASKKSQSDDTPLMRELRRDTELKRRLDEVTFDAPPQTRIMAVANQKGGVGKTSTAVNLAAALAQGGLQVMLIDSDPQGNASTALGVEHNPDIHSVYDVVVDSMPLKDIVIPSSTFENLVCAPATIDLSGAEIELVPMVARESRLRNAIADYVSYREQEGLPRLDYVFIDCPPSLGLLTINALVAAQEVLMPIQAEYYALEGIAMLWKNIDLIQQHLNADLRVSTILLTMFDGRTRLAQQVAEDVREHFPDQTLETVIPRSVRVSEAPSYGETVITYDPESSGALAYRSAAYEINLRSM